MLSRLLSGYWLLLPLLIIVVIAIDRIEEPVAMEVEETIDMRETRSDYYMSDFRSRKFSKDGKIEYTVQGSTLAHFPDTDRSEIVAPRVELNRPEAIWNIRSNSGRFDTNPDLFVLLGDVVVERRQSGAEPVTITTSSLTVATQSNKVSTDQPITISAPHWSIKATGMTSAIDDGKLVLHSAIRGRFEMPDAR